MKRQVSHLKPKGNMSPNLAFLQSFQAQINPDTLREFTSEDKLSFIIRDRIDHYLETDMWDCQTQLPWFYVTKRSHPLPTQGWKLHISASNQSAPEVLEAVLPLLLKELNAFKLAANLHVLQFLNSGHAPRESSGKFITIYPHSEKQAVEVAEACDKLTRGFRGPRILSDQPFNSSSLVHYRYGSFARRVELNADGRYVNTIVTPEGLDVPDERNAWFSPPAWTSNPFRVDVKPTSKDAFVLNSRYTINAALRHANKGGVYKGTDHSTGEHVLIKEARPNVATDEHGRDAVVRLKHEAAVLGLLRDTSLAPKLIDFFEYGNHMFLVEEFLEGDTLRAYIAKNQSVVDLTLSRDKVAMILTKICDLLTLCHKQNILFRDLTPNNIFVTAQNEVLFIDFELAYCQESSDPLNEGGTPGYVSPQQRRSEQPNEGDDYYSLGAIVYFVSTGRDPYLPNDEKATSHVRINKWLQALKSERLVSSSVANIISACLEEDAMLRWSPIRVKEELERREQPETLSDDISAQHSSDHALYTEERNIQYKAAIVEIANCLIESVDFDSRVRPWSSTCFGLDVDACSIQNGASGIGMFLLKARSYLEQPRIDYVIRQLTYWILRDLETMPNRSPGLYFGSSGIAWFLLAAGKALEDENIISSSKKLAGQLPLTSSFADITHGLAGIGMTQLFFFRMTNDILYLRRAEQAAHQLLKLSLETKHGLIWPVPEGTNSSLAGTVSYGFAHGNAGIAHFFMLLHKITNINAYLTNAHSTMNTLVSSVEIIDEAAYWPLGPNRPSKWPHWCNGSSGIGSTLVRMYHLTHEEIFRELAERSAKAVMAYKWRSSPVQCHGLAGNGEFLLDLYTFLGDKQYWHMSHDLTDVLFNLRVVQDGYGLFPDESHVSTSPDYGTGYSGVGTFLHRLVSNNHRSFMLDEFFYD